LIDVLIISAVLFACHTTVNVKNVRLILKIPIKVAIFAYV